MTAIQRFAIHGTIMNPHSSGPYVRHEDHLAAMQGRCLAQIEEPAGEAPAAGAGPAWDKTRDSLATLLLGLARRPFLDFDVACIALDAATEPGMPLAYMRAAPTAPALEAPPGVAGRTTPRNDDERAAAQFFADNPSAAVLAWPLYLARDKSTALEAPAAPEVIDIGDGGQLRMDPDMHGAWQLFRGDSHIRYLDKFERNFVNSAIRAALTETARAPAGLQAAPVAGQSRFAGETTWGSCTVEHVDMVLAAPTLWGRYEVRYLYAAPQAPAAPVTVALPAMPPTDDRRPYDDAEPEGYMESDNEWIDRNLVAVRWFIDNHTSVRALAASLSAPAAPAVDASDAARMDWLEAQVVNVRAPLRYGSRDMFWASPEEVDGGPDGPSDLRARIDAAQAAAQGAA